MPKIINIYDSFESQTLPVVINLPTSILNKYLSDAEYESVEGSVSQGSIYLNSTANTVRYYNGLAWTELIDLSSPQVLSNKSFSGSVEFDGDVTIEGDLTVNGEVVSINVTELKVEDNNITLNKGGTEATATNAGLEVEITDGVNASVLYDKLLSSRFKLGEAGDYSEVITASHEQTLTNKDIDGGIASDTNRITIPKGDKADLDSLPRKEASLVYATDQEKVYLDSGAELIPVGSNFKYSGSFTDSFNITKSITIASGSWEAESNGDTVLLNMEMDFSGSGNKYFDIQSIDFPTNAPTPKDGLYHGFISLTDPNPSSEETLDSPITLKKIGGLWKLLGNDSIGFYFTDSNPATGYLTLSYIKSN